MRTQTRRRWSLYGITVALGLYTHLLFSAVAVAHGVYVAITEKPLQQRRISKIAIAYLLATAAATLAFVPWIALFLSQFNRFGDTQEFGQESSSLLDLVSEWVENINQAFLGESIGPANGLLALLAIYALYWLCRRTPQRTWLFVLTLVGVPFLALAVPDIVWGGGRSLRIRYVIPSYVGIQLALAYLFATQAIRIKTAPQTLWRMVLLLLLTGNLIACIAIAQAQFWWSKGGTRCAYYFPVAAVLNSAEVPLVISDRRPSDLLGLTHYLNPPVYYQPVTDPKRLQIAPQFQAKFLLNPSPELREELSQQGYRLKLLYQDPNEDGIDQKRFWQVGDRR